MQLPHTNLIQLHFTIFDRSGVSQASKTVQPFSMSLSMIFIHNRRMRDGCMDIYVYRCTNNIKL